MYRVQQRMAGTFTSFPVYFQFQRGRSSFGAAAYWQPDTALIAGGSESSSAARTAADFGKPLLRPTLHRDNASLTTLDLDIL